MAKAEKEATLWGKAWIGGVSTLWLPTRLIIGDDLIQLQAFFGTYYFPDDSIISITRLSRKKVLITHAIKEYPSRIVFSAQGAYREIQKRDFQLTATVNSIRHIRSDGGAVKDSVIAVLVTVCFVIISLSAYFPYFTAGVCALVGFCCIALLVSETLRNLALKPDRKFSEIVKNLSFMIFLALVWSLLSLVMTYVCGKTQVFCPDSCYDEQGRYIEDWCPHKDDLREALSRFFEGVVEF